jgi:hypothetical protein
MYQSSRNPFRRLSVGTITSTDAGLRAGPREDARSERSDPAIGEPERLDWVGALAWVATLTAGVVFWVGSVLLLLYLVL